jgi:hypothetical protein
VASSIHGVARLTNDVDLLVALTPGEVDAVAAAVATKFYMDPGEATRSIRMGRAFNVLHLASAWAYMAEWAPQPGVTNPLQRLKNRNQLANYLPLRINERNSSRVSLFVRKAPSIALVTVEDSCFCTPRIIMQKCCASATTATPWGSTIS